MSYIDQMKAWLKKHPKATIEDAYKAGYFQSTENWVIGYTGFVKINGRMTKTGKEYENRDNIGRGS